jgi:hypothetical protein
MLTATLSAGMYSLHPGQSTTLTATVSANPGGGGVPSGSITFMLGSTTLGTETLLPVSVAESAATIPLSASQLSPGANALTAFYSGNSVYGSTTSTPITVTLK